MITSKGPHFKLMRESGTIQTATVNQIRMINNILFCNSLKEIASQNELDKNYLEEMKRVIKKVKRNSIENY